MRDPRVDAYIDELPDRKDEPINARTLTAIFRPIIANNRAGGWRKLKREGAPPGRSHLLRRPAIRPRRAA